jgi:hypothetical protein
MAQNRALAGQLRDWLGRGSPERPNLNIPDATNAIRREHATEFLQSTAGEVIYGPGAFLGDGSDIINVDYPILPRGGPWKAAAFLHTHLDANDPLLSGTDVAFGRETGISVAAYHRATDVLNVFVPGGRAGTIYQITNFRARSP